MKKMKAKVAKVASPTLVFHRSLGPGETIQKKYETAKGDLEIVTRLYDGRHGKIVIDASTRDDIVFVRIYGSGFMLDDQRVDQRVE
jgi:hypothetical protein